MAGVEEKFAIKLKLLNIHALNFSTKRAAGELHIIDIELINARDLVVRRIALAQLHV